MTSVGNAKAQVAFASCGLPPKPSRDAAQIEKLEYVGKKYTQCTPDWSIIEAPSAPAPKPPAPTPPAPTPAVSLRPAPAATSKSKLPGATRAAPPLVPAATPPRPASPNLIDFETPLVVAHAPAPASDAQFFAQFGL